MVGSRRVDRRDFQATFLHPTFYFLGMWHQNTDSLAEGPTEGNIAALAARVFAGITGVKVSLAGLALQEFPGARDLDALRHRLIGLQFHTGGL